MDDHHLNNITKLKKKKNITLARGIYGTFLLFGISYGEKNVLQAKGSASSTNDRGPY
jgi:hypothetical protein